MMQCVDQLQIDFARGLASTLRQHFFPFISIIPFLVPLPGSVNTWKILEIAWNLLELIWDVLQAIWNILKAAWSLLEGVWDLLMLAWGIIKNVRNAMDVAWSWAFAIVMLLRNF